LDIVGSFDFLRHRYNLSELFDVQKKKIITFEKEVAAPDDYISDRQFYGYYKHYFSCGVL
jgi:hypothetical protein